VLSNSFQENAMGAFLNKHKVWLATIAAGAISFLTPSMQEFIKNHSQYAVVVGTLWGFAAAWAKSPRS
jgi:hypothetical protein